ncbi:hypothetical protein BN7_6575 [Wickerhamomyces ciferrii]|uniref:Arrestin-like N-terminal domain-containing protein n=1 Tax=Wickerhamomyces ciferrii (strain ATCC 14091 / BCRC 22168 / CBS 111 / JCM 3599 / NBRC 0793 / NRRL Y-1031 F-60-10) TaxID=1206466 RepID=K0L0K3_WICCF|nr:uncharacterized protein BN7_6575 [Wickerhamomyces ciferrii]CCH46968.1 hypothetical protein BN7_6575 [Wickerhamomyces ciferrii]
MGSKSVNITIQLNNTNGYKYKPLDIIRGRVFLRVYKEINIKDVIVNFYGTSRSQFYVIERRRNMDTGEMEDERICKTETHTVAYDGCIIFPPPNVRSVSNNKAFTLTPGEYVYDFAFKIPLRNRCGTGKRTRGHGDTRLPPSMGITGVGSINYRVQVTIRRASRFRSNIEEYKYPNITCFDPIEDIISYAQPFSLRKSVVLSNQIHKRIALTEKPTGPESYEIPMRKSTRKKSSHFIKSLFGSKEPPPKFAQEYDVPFVFEVECSSPILRINQAAPDLKIFLKSKYGPNTYRGIDNQTSGLGHFILEEFGIYLIGTYSVIAEDRSIQKRISYRLTFKGNLSMNLDLADLEPNPLYGTAEDSNPFQLEFPRFLYENATVPKGIKPTFDTCNIKVDYKLNIRARFLEEQKGWYSKSVELFKPVSVITGVPAPQEYIEMKQIPPHLAQQVLETYPPEAFRRPDDFTPLYDDTTAAPASLNVEETESVKQDEKQKLDEHYSQAQEPEESLPTYGSATKEHQR